MRYEQLEFVRMFLSRFFKPVPEVVVEAPVLQVVKPVQPKVIRGCRMYR